MIPIFETSYLLKILYWVLSKYKKYRSLVWTPAKKDIIILCNKPAPSPEKYLRSAIMNSSFANSFDSIDFQLWNQNIGFENLELFSHIGISTNENAIRHDRILSLFSDLIVPTLSATRTSGCKRQMHQRLRLILIDRFSIKLRNFFGSVLYLIKHELEMKIVSTAMIGGIQKIVTCVTRDTNVKMYHTHTE